MFGSGELKSAGEGTGGTIEPMPNPIRLAILASGSGTTFQNFLDQIAAGHLNAQCAILIASRPGIKAIDRAMAAKVPHALVDRKQFSTLSEFSQQVFQYINQARPDLICLAGWLSMLQIPLEWRDRIMNIHPALLPSFGGKGMYGGKVHQAVIAHGCKLSGCTVHFVDDQYDNGPIILQRACPVMEGDTPEMLAHRVFEEEKIAYPEAIGLYQEGRLRIEDRRVRVLGADEGKFLVRGADPTEQP